MGPPEDKCTTNLIANLKTQVRKKHVFRNNTKTTQEETHT